MKLSALVSGVAHSPLPADPDITAVCYDSRKAAPGALFVCLPGARTDGHAYAPAAYAQGCRVFLAQQALPLPADAVQVLCADTRAALAVLGAEFYGDPAKELRLVGITGTKGKTTTALLTAAVLTAAGLPCGYIGSNGVQFGATHLPTVNTTPESIELQRFFRLMADAGMRCCVLEVSSQALAHHRVDGVTFEAVAFTNLSPDHIGPGEHPDLADYKNSKRRLFTEHGARRMVCNADDAAAGFMCAGFAGQVVRYGTRAGTDFRGLYPRRYRGDRVLGVSFTCRQAGQDTRVRLLSPGRFSVSDALCALALCAGFGVGVAQAAATLAVTPVQGRFEVVPALPGRTFIIDYAHNGLSLTAALQTLRAYRPRRLVCVVGSVGGRTQGRRAELAAAASAWADFTILTADNPDHEDPAAIIAEMAAHMAPGAAYACLPDRADAVAAAVHGAQPGDIVLFAGKGHEDYQLVNGQKLPFSERALILAAAGA